MGVKGGKIRGEISDAGYSREEFRERRQGKLVERFLFAATAAATYFRSLSTSRGISTHPDRTSWLDGLNIAGAFSPSREHRVSPITTSLNRFDSEKPEIRSVATEKEKAFFDGYAET